MNPTNPTNPEFLDTIKGFLDPEEGRGLYGIALQASRLGPCLEIGSYCGKSAVYLGSACRENGAVLFSIDHHRGSEEQQPGEAYFDAELFDFSTFAMDTFPLFRRTLALAGLAAEGLEAIGDEPSPARERLNLRDGHSVGT